MFERIFKIPSILVLLMLMYELVIPIGSVTANSAGILPPSNLTYQQSTAENVKLTWSAVFGASEYKLYEIKEGSLVALGTTTGTSYSLNGLSEGSYSYVVSTLSGEEESGPSAPVTVKVSYPEMLAPASQTFTIRNGNDIVLNWDASQNAQRYNVYQLSSTGEKSLLTNTSTRSYTITNSAEGKYTYAVSAEHTFYGESALSNSLEVEVSHPVMAEPANLTFTITNGTDVTLRWQEADFATNYNIYQVINGQLELKDTVKNTSKRFVNLPAGDYVYKVYSVSDRFSESAEGSQVSLSVGSIVMTAPNNANYEIRNTNDAFLKWEAVPYATDYKVYQIVDGEKVLKTTVTGTSVTFTKQPSGNYEYEIYSYSDRYGESEWGSKVSLSIESVGMLPPTGLNYKIQNGNDIVLNWTAAENATNYNIYKVLGGQKTLERTVSGTSVTFTNQSAGDQIFEVHSYSSRFGESVDGTTITVKLDQVHLSTPQGASYAVKNGNDIALSWDTVEYTTDYKVYQIIDGERTLNRTVEGTTTTLGNMPEGVYLFEIYANSSRFGESREGVKVSLTLVHPEMNPPLNVSHIVKTATSFTLNWEASEYANTYKVYQIIKGEKVLKSTVSGTFVSYSNMAPGRYQYEVYSYSSRFGESSKGSPIEVVVEGQAMQAPENLSNTIRNGNDVVLKWDLVQYANSYNIYQVIDGEEVLLKNVTGTSMTLNRLQEGEYVFIVKSLSNLLGESLNGAELKVFISSHLMDAPANITTTITNGNDITLRWDSVEFATDYNIYEIVDGERVLKRTATGTSAVLSNMAEGEHKFEIYSYSDRFGDSPEGIKAVVTIVFPIMQAPENLTQSINNGNDIILKWNAADYAKEYKVYQVVNGEKIFKKSTTGTSMSFTNMPEGDYHFEVHSHSDRFGESPKSSVIEFNLTWPSVQPPVVEGTVFNANNITLSWPTVTWANEYRVYKINGKDRELIYKGSARSHKIFNLTEETHSFAVTAFSTRFGESEISNVIQEKIVYPIMQAPKANLKLLTQTSAQISWNFVTYANGYNIYELIDEKSVLVAEKINNLSYVLQNLTYANHEYYVTSYSNSFGESIPSETVIAKLIVDTTAPETKANAQTEWVNQNQLVTLEATDDETGVAKTFYSLNDSPFEEGTSIAIEQEGVNNISFYSVDNVGNTEQVKTVSVKIDKTAPVTEINKIPEYAQLFTVQLTGKDELSGIYKTYYSINGSDFVEGTSITIYEEGINKFSYYSVDQAGNKEEVKNAVVQIDKTAPVTSSDEPKSWVKNDVTIMLAAEDEQSGVANTYYSINGSDYLEGTSFTIDQEGINEISYYSVDHAGNKEEVNTTVVKIDKTAPVTSSNEPKSWVKEDVAITLVAEDAQSQVDKIYYSINGSDYVEGTTFTVDQEGINEISYYSVDQAGNKEKVKTTLVQIDKTAPTLTVNVESEYELGITHQLDYLLEDNLSGVASADVTLNGKAYQKGDQIILDQPGEYKLVIRGTDAAGWTTIVEKTFVAYVPANLEVLPKVIKGNKGVFTVKATLPSEYQSYSFDVTSVTLNGVSTATDNKGLQKQAQKGHFKFNREDFTWTTGTVNLEFRGYLDNGILVVGHATVEAKK